jgi:putative hydrolase of the HAD superfamily
MMIGNSMKSDVLPAIEAGAWGVFVPHGLTWELEHAKAPDAEPRVFVNSIALGGVLDLLAQIES